MVSSSALVTKTPHDALFKSVFQHPENAVTELQHVLAPEPVSAIDWATLKLEPGSFVDEKFAYEHSDLLFSADARGSGERVLVYVLFEHQSTAEPKMALRLLSYMVRIWERFSDDEKNKKSPLPLIVIEAAARGGRPRGRPSSTSSTSNSGSRPPGVEGPDGERGPVGVVPRRNGSERIEAAELAVEPLEVVLVPHAEDEAGAVTLGVGVEVLDGPVVEGVGVPGVEAGGVLQGVEGPVVVARAM